MLPMPDHIPTPASTHPPPPTQSPWGPYSGPGNFTANMIIIVIILFCSLVLILAISVLIRHLFRYFLQFRARPQQQQQHRRQESTDLEKGPSAQQPSSSVADSLPIIVFSSANNDDAESTSECAICLAEFADGDGVRVLPACKHGFHAGCIEAWLGSKKSCPTCRTICHVAED